VVVVDRGNHALRTVSKAGAVVSTLAGNGEEGSPDGEGADAAFNDPFDVVLAANGDLLTVYRQRDPRGCTLVRRAPAAGRPALLMGRARWTLTAACSLRIWEPRDPTCHHRRRRQDLGGQRGKGVCQWLGRRSTLTLPQ